jgi:hypothetical protein
MKKNLDCPICEKIVYSSVGGGCKLCGMPLNDKNENFCSENCRIKYLIIHLKNKMIYA